MAEAKKEAAPKTARKPRATKKDDAPTTGDQSYRPEPLPQRTGTHTRDYDPK